MEKDDLALQIKMLHDQGMTIQEISQRIARSGEWVLKQIKSCEILPSVQRIDISDVVFAQQLKRMLSCNPMLTVEDLSEKLDKSVKWIYDQLKLLDDPEPLIVEGNK